MPIADLLGALKRHRLGLFALAMIVLRGAGWCGRLAARWRHSSSAWRWPSCSTRSSRSSSAAACRAGPACWSPMRSSSGSPGCIIAFALPPIGQQARELISTCRSTAPRSASGRHRSSPGPVAHPACRAARAASDASVTRAQEAFGQIVRRSPARSSRRSCARRLPARPRHRPGVAVLRPEGPRALPRRGAGGALPGVARRRGRHPRHPRPHRRPLGPGPALAGGVDLPATTIGLTILTFIGFGELGQVHAGARAHRRRARVVPDHRSDHRRHPGHPHRPVDLAGGRPRGVILYTAVQQLENNLLVPKVMGDAVELHPAVMIMSLVIGGALFGIGGAILAAPIGGDRPRPVPLRLPAPVRHAGSADQSRGRAAVEPEPRSPKRTRSQPPAD